MIKQIIFIVSLSFTIETHANLLINHNEKTDKLLFKKVESENQSEKIDNTHNNSVKAIPAVKAIPVIQSLPTKVTKPKPKPKPLTRWEIVQNEINAEVRNMNSEINLYNIAKNIGNIEKASTLLKSILDRKATIKVLKKEQVYY